MIRTGRPDLVDWSTSHRRRDDGAAVAHVARLRDPVSFQLTSFDTAAEAAIAEA
jgi:hypothetical protein